MVFGKKQFIKDSDIVRTEEAQSKNQKAEIPLIATQLTPAKRLIVNNSLFKAEKDKKRRKLIPLDMDELIFGITNKK